MPTVNGAWAREARMRSAKFDETEEAQPVLAGMDDRIVAEELQGQFVHGPGRGIGKLESVN